MITTLTGTNTFALRAELRRMTDGFITEHTDLGLEKFYGEDSQFDRMREALESLPFLASKKLVVLRAPSTNKEFAEKAVSLLENIPETTDVIIYEPKLDKRQSYYKFLKKKSEFKEFNELDIPGLAKWLSVYANEQGGSISQSDARYLAERVGTDQHLLANELDKLLAYETEVTRTTIDLLTEPTPQSSIFELLDAALAGKTDRAMELYREQRALKVEPQQIIAMLAWQLRILAVVKTAGGRDASTIAKEARINPFVVRKSQGIASRMSLAEIKQLIHRTLELDIRLKSESIDADEALQHYLLTL
jgi:DNA polymerase-3 subunit delta